MAQTTPQDRKTSKAEQAKLAKKQEELAREFLSTGIDFTPFTIDAGDGIEWGFHPDPMPTDTERLRRAIRTLEEANKAEDGDRIAEAFAGLTEAVRSLLLDEKQKAEFPKPLYGARALLFFALSIATGRSGFPTQQD